MLYTCCIINAADGSRGCSEQFQIAAVNEDHQRTNKEHGEGGERSNKKGEGRKPEQHAERSKANEDHYRGISSPPYIFFSFLERNDDRTQTADLQEPSMKFNSQVAITACKTSVASLSFT